MAEDAQKTMGQRVVDAEKHVAELDRAYKKWKNAAYWIGGAIIIVLLIVASVNVHYIRATESTFSQLQEAINAVSAEATDSIGKSRKITVEVNQDNLLSADYLAGVIPVIIGLAGALVVFLGMERLKAFDERIDSTHSEIDEKLDGFDEKLEKNHTALRGELTTDIGNRLSGFDGKLTDFDKRIAQNRSELQRELRTESDKRLNELSAKLDSFDGKLTDFDKRIGQNRREVQMELRTESDKRLNEFGAKLDSFDGKLTDFDKRIGQNRREVQMELRTESDKRLNEFGAKLDSFDGKIEQNRNTLRAELTTEAERSVQSKFIQEQEKWTERSKAVSEAQNKSIDELNKHKEDLSNALDDEALKRLQELDAKAQEYIAGLNSYAWLKAIIKEGETEISVPTVEDAHRLTERLHAQKPAGHIDMIRQVVDKVCNETLSGDKADYHNFSAELARGNMYNEACRILERGLVFFPTDTDLLSDLVEYAAKGSMFEKAKNAVDKLQNEIPKRQWNWRCYEFICDYYQAVGNIEAAYEICSEFIEAIPDDEHGYRSKSELERLMNPGQSGIERSIATLRLALERNITCPQCANQLSEILLDNGRFEEALEAANRAIRDLAQQQPHVNVAYVFYNRANIMDRMFLQGQMTAEEGQSMAENACEDYIMALSLGQLTMIVSNQANARIQILSSHLSPEVKERIENKRKEVQRTQTLDLMRLIQGMGNDNNADDNA